jgi:DNA-binding MarR family transcriptional regulator
MTEPSVGGESLDLADVARMARLVKTGGRSLLCSTLRHLHGLGYDQLRLPHSQVFENIDPDGTRLTVLAERAGITHQAMGALVGELIRCGYLERVADPRDGRARLVRPTATGRDVVEAGAAYLRVVHERWARLLHTSSLGDVLDALEALPVALDE